MGYLTDYKISQVTDDKCTIGIIRDEEAEDSDFVFNNMRVMAMCIGRTITEDMSKRLEIYDVTAYRTWDKASIYPDYIYSIARAPGGRVGLYVSTPVSIVAKPDYPYEQLGQIKASIKDAAIAFDGDWILNDTTSLYSLKEDNEPWIAYVTAKGALWVQRGLNPSADYKIELVSSKVKLVAMERGYFPEGYEDLNTDQGLVVAYVTTNNKLKYFTYAKTNSDNDRVWMGADDVYGADYTNKTIVNLQVHRLNDYRIGINVTTKEPDENKQVIYKNYWHITLREYSAMAFRAETFEFEPFAVHSPLYCYIDFDTSVTAAVQPEWTWSINDAHTVVTVLSNLPIRMFNNYEKYFTSNGSALRHTFFTQKGTQSGFAGIKSIKVLPGDAEGYFKGFEITFKEAVIKNFTMTLTPQPSIDFAVEVDVYSGGGMCTVTETVSQEIDILNDIEYNYNENFEIEPFKVTNIDMKCVGLVPVEKYETPQEHFEIEPFAVKDIDVLCKVVEIQEYNYNENFEIESFAVKSVNINSIVVVPTIPV